MSSILTSLSTFLFTYSPDANTTIAPSIPPTHLFTLALISSIPYLFLQYLIIPKFISEPFSESYRHILKNANNPKNDAKERRKAHQTVILWNNFILSSIHAVYAFAIAFYSLFLSGDFADASLSTASMQASKLVMLSMGYFIADFIIGARAGILDAGAIIHHLVVLSSELFLLVYWRFHIVGLASMLTELTTPLINNRWLMDKSNMKDSMLYVVNGLAIWFGWVVCRLAFSFWLIYYIYTNRVEFFFGTPIFCSMFMCLQGFLLSSLNFYWFFKITKGVVKALFGKPTPPSLQKKVE